MRFDGYGATIRTETPREIVACLADALNTKPEAGPAVRRFGVTTGLTVPVLVAGVAGLTAVFVAATGMTQAASVPRSFPCVHPE